MTYTKEEKGALDMFNRTDFKNISKKEIVNCFSVFNQLSVDDRKEALARFPELVDLFKNLATNHQAELETIIESDGESLDNFYEIYSKGLDTINQSRKEFSDNINVVLESFGEDLNRADNPEERIIIFEQIDRILDRQEEMDEKKQKQVDEILKAVKDKDDEKRQFDLKVMVSSNIMTAMITAIAFTVLGGKFMPKLPIKK